MSKVARFVVSPFNALLGDKATAAALAIASAIPGPHQPFAVAASAAFGAYQQLTAPKPIARGSPAQVTIDIEPPRPYVVGQVMTGGVLRHDVAYGAPVAKVPNPYRWQVRVLSGVGPIQGIVSEHFDFEPISSFYSGFYATQQNLGARPQTSALVPTYGPAPGWDASSRLSGCAHVGLNFLFDKDGKRYASGLPTYTALVDGEKVYDPRLDSTYPGGSGSCRAGVESTYVYSANPACHALTYALGRFQNGIRVFGLGQPADTIDLPAIVDWANDCDANGWTVNMVLTEGGTGANLREQRVRNLDDLCAAGGGRWYQAGGLLSFDWHRPRVSLATLTDDDILEAGGGTDAVPTVRDRMNGVRPQYVSPAHNWQQITADEIVGSTYRTEDGEALTQVYPLNGVTNAEQAGELAAYAMADSREIGPMDVQAKVNWRFYRPGDCITVDSSLMAYDGQAVINQRSLNPQTLAVSLSLKSETPGKHDFALGKVADPPPTPTLAQTAEERDLLAAAAIAPRDEDVTDLVAPANANRVPLSRMEGDSGWAVFREGSTGGAAFPALISGRSFILADPVFSASAQNHYLFNDPPIPVIPGERLSIGSALEIFPLSGPTSAAWQFYVVFLNAWGDFVSSVDVGVGVGNSPFSLTERVSGFVTVPAGGVRAVLNLRVQSAGAGQMRMGFLEPMVTSAAPGQTVHPDFTPGPVLTGPVDAGGPMLIGQLPTDKAVADLRNTTVTLAGLRSARPVSGAFIGQRYNATDTREAFRWDGFNWQAEADVTATVSGPADITMQFRADLALLSPLPLTADYQLGVAGASPLTSGVSWSVAVVSGTFAGAAPSMVGSGGGQLRINSALTSPEAELRITASVGGRASPPFVAKVRRQVAAPSVAALTFINSSAFAIAHDQPIQITLPAGVSSVALTAVADLFVNPGAPVGSTTVEGKWQRETSPGTWADVGAVAASSPNPEVFETEIAPGEFVFSADPGSITCNRTATGLTPGTIQRFRFVARVSLGNVRDVLFNGNASAVA